MGVKQIRFNEEVKRWEESGRHAVAITGYSTNRRDIDSSLLSNTINKIYIHDDSIGPFTSAVFRSNISLQNFDREKFLDNENDANFHFIVDEKANKERYIPYILFVPLYHKIRTQLAPIRTSIYALNQLIISGLKKTIKTKKKYNLPIKWDIYLTDINSLKQEYLNHILAIKNPKIKKDSTKVLTIKMP